MKPGLKRLSAANKRLPGLRRQPKQKERILNENLPTHRKAVAR